MQSPVPEFPPHLIAPDTWLIPNLVAAGPDGFLPVSSMVIRGREPIVIDTGAPVHRDPWFDKVFSLVEPEDVRWVFLSHDDGDHKGQLFELLERCPNATLVVNGFLAERQGLEEELPVTRTRWLEPGDVLDVGDRRLHLVLPPIFDGPTTRGLYDDRTGAMWAVDSFAALLSGDGVEYHDVPRQLYDETFPLFNSLISPWHQWLDRARYGRHIDSVARLAPSVVASAHGPVLRGEAIPDAFNRVRAMAGAPRLLGPGQDVLDELIAAVLAETPLPAPV